MENRKINYFTGARKYRNNFSSIHIETSKIGLVFIVLFLTLESCRYISVGHNKNLTHNNGETNIDKCANDPFLFVSTTNNLLYKDSLGVLHLKLPREVDINTKSLNKCDSIPFFFINEMALINDSIVMIENYIDPKFFTRFNESDIYFKDNNSVYVYREFPVCSPAFYQILIDQHSMLIMDSTYIKDKNAVFWKGIKVDEADPLSFGSFSPNAAYDKNNLYFFDKKIVVEELGKLPFDKAGQDSLKTIYFDKNINQKDLFTPLNDKELLFKDEKNDVYLEVEKSQIGTDQVNYVYYNELGFNDSIYSLKEIIDTASFANYNGSEIFFRDRNSVYIYQEFPPSHPPIKKLNINLSESQIVSREYIKDENFVYWLGIKMKNADAKSFSVFKELRGENWFLAFDKNYIYNGRDRLSKEDLLTYPIEKEKLDSLVKLYFSESK